MRRLFVFLLLCGGLSAQILSPIVAASFGPPNTPLDSNSGGGCTGSSPTWTCTGAPTITITDATALAIYYTTNGSTPSCPATGTLYTAPFTGPSSTFTLKAIGCNGITGGVVLTSVYTISAGTTVTFTNVCSGTAGNCNITGTPAAGSAVVFVFWSSASATVSTVCDGTGTGGCTGTSTYTAAVSGGYANATNFRSWVYFTCNYQGTASPTAMITVTMSSGAASYLSGVYASGNTTTGTNCNDGYAHNQAGSGTSYTSGAVTTTNSHDLLVGLFSNNSGGGTYCVTAGNCNDSQGNTMTLQAVSTNVVAATSFNETATNTYTPVATYGTTSQWNAETLAIK